MNRTALACTTIASLSVSGAIVLAPRVTAGPLAPPAGPVASTYKTLNEVEPRIAINATNTPGDADSLFRITQPGSYYLTGNITGVTGKHGIEIAADNVTVDLMGHTLRGVSGSLNGVYTAITTRGVTVRNGAATRWGEDGVTLQTGPGNLSQGGLVESINASLNGLDGISGCIGGVIRNCTADSNGQYGISSNTGSVIEGCTARLNVYGGFGGSSTTFSNCSAGENLDHGFRIGSGSIAINCTSSNNTGNGFNSTTRGSSFIQCSAYYNTENGIWLDEANTAVDCTVVGSGTHGIVAGGFCVVRNNLCSSSGFATGVTNGSGVFVMSSSNTIEGNSCTYNDIGIGLGNFASSNRIDGNTARSNGISFDIRATDNIVIRNIAHGGSPNYLIAAGNSVAPRVSVADSDGWAGISNADHPWANFGH